MGKFAWALCVVAMLFGACSSKSAVTTSTSTPGSSAAPGAEPKTAEELRAVAQLHFNSFAAEDFGSFWDDFDSSSKTVVSRTEYIRRLTTCMRKDPTRGKPFRVVGATDNHDGTWSVTVILTNLQITFPARYEGGKWRFVLSGKARDAMTMPFDQYISSQCAQ